MGVLPQVVKGLNRPAWRFPTHQRLGLYWMNTLWQPEGRHVHAIIFSWTVPRTQHDLPQECMVGCVLKSSNNVSYDIRAILSIHLQILHVSVLKSVLMQPAMADRHTHNNNNVLIIQIYRFSNCLKWHIFKRLIVIPVLVYSCNSV